MKKNCVPLLFGTLLLLSIFIMTPVLEPFFESQTMTAKAASKNPLNYKTKRLLKGESFLLEADTDKKVTFSSKNKRVATISKSGVVRAKRAGQAVICAKIGRKTYTCKVTVSDTVDLILFAGQSNMTGRGDVTQAPKLTDGAGYECKTITNVNNLEPITEPFGLKQDRGTMSDGNLRTGSLVTAFANAYYKQTKVPLVGVSATVVGSGRVSWSTLHYKEAARRLNLAKKALKKKKLKIRHTYMVYMQGENDGFAGCSVNEYQKSLKLLFKNMQKKTDVESCLIIRIGTYTKQPSLYNNVLKAQTNLCRDSKNFVLISTKAASLSNGYYAEDGIHINQKGLNIIGTEAGKHAGIYATTGKEPSMKDAKYKNTYKPKKQNTQSNKNDKKEDSAPDDTVSQNTVENNTSGTSIVNA